MIGSLILIKQNIKAFYINHVLIIVGILLIGFGTRLFETGLITSPIWMIVSGFGLYMAYVPFNSVLFERLIASFHIVSNVGFLIYLADSFGYLGSIGILFYKQFGQPSLSWIEFFISLGYIITISGGLMMTLSLFYFYRKAKVITTEDLMLAQPI